MKNQLKSTQKILSPTDSHLAASYTGIGLAYDNMDGCSKALLYHEKALGICKKSLPSNHPDFTTSYNNFGAAYTTMGDYLKALPFFERALDIGQRSLPANHPHLHVLKKQIEFLKTFNVFVVYLKNKHDVKRK
jgi:tetratricopeptide (TPR) repeat protein